MLLAVELHTCGVYVALQLQGLLISSERSIRTTAWMAFEFAGTMVALAAYLYQSLPPGPAHAGAASALGLMLLAEAGLFIKRCDDEAMRRKAD